MRGLPIALLLLAVSPALAETGLIRLQGADVLLERQDRPPLRLRADDAEGERILATLRRFEGERATVEGAASAAGLVARKLVYPFLTEADVVVMPRPGGGGRIVRCGDSPLRPFGPAAPVLARAMGDKVRVRGWFFMDRWGALPDAVAVVGVRHTPPVGPPVWITSLEGDVARGRGARGEALTVRAADLRLGPQLGRPRRVRGRYTFQADGAKLRTTQGEVFDLRGGEGTIPDGLVDFDGRDGVTLQGTAIDGVLYVERVLSPVPVEVTGVLTGPGMLQAGSDAVTLFGSEHRGPWRALAAAPAGIEVTVVGLATQDATGGLADLLVRRVAGDATGAAAVAMGDFAVPADGRVWIDEASADGSTTVRIGDDPHGAGVMPAGAVRVGTPTLGVIGVLQRR